MVITLKIYLWLFQRCFSSSPFCLIFIIMFSAESLKTMVPKKIGENLRSKHKFLTYGTDGSFMSAAKRQRALHDFICLCMIAGPFTKMRAGGVPCTPTNRLAIFPFEPTSKRRKGFPSETHVKRGDRVVHGDKDLVEKLGRNDPCPCGSGRRFQGVLSKNRTLRRFPKRLLLLDSVPFLQVNQRTPSAPAD